MRATDVAILVLKVVAHEVGEWLWPASILDMDGCAWPWRHLGLLWASELGRCRRANRLVLWAMNACLIMRPASGVVRVIVEPVPAGMSR